MKIIRKTNFRVIIEPRALGNLGFVQMADRNVSQNIERDYEERCEEILADVKRHCNNVGFAAVQFDSEEICSFCGLNWELEPDGFTPACCAKAQEEVFPAQKLN